MRDDILDDGDSGSSGERPARRHKHGSDPIASVEVELPLNHSVELVHQHDIKVQLPQEQMFVRPDQLGTGVAFYQPVSIGQSNSFSAVSLPTNAFQPVTWDSFWFKGGRGYTSGEADQLIGSFVLALFEFIAKLLGGRKVSFRQKIRSMKER